MENNKDHQTKIPAEQVKQLEIFAGKWKIDGKNFPSAPGSGETPVQGEDKYEWLRGNFFLVSNWSHTFEGGGHQGVSVLGFDEEEKKLFTKNFDNLGYERKYMLDNEHNNWKFIGDKERATREFSNDGKHYTEHWEIKDDKGQWMPLCIMNGTKVS